MRPRQLSWKWLLLGLVAFALVCLALLSRHIGNSEQLRGRVTAALSEWTGGEVTLIEPWSVRYFPPLSIRGGLVVRDATRLPFVRSIAAKDAKISLDVGQLLFGRVSIDGMRLNRADISLKGDEPLPSGSTASLPALVANLLEGTTVSAMQVRNATISSRTGEEIVTNLDARFDAGEGSGALSGFGSLDLRGETVRFVVESEALVEQETGASVPFRLRIAGPVMASVSGDATFGNGMELSGHLEAEIEDGRNFLNWAGIPVPKGRSLQGLSVAGPMHWAGGTLTIDGGAFVLDGNSAAGLLAVTMRHRPRIEGTLAFEQLMLDPYIGPGEPDTAPAPGGALLDWALLKYLDADLRISASHIATSTMELGRGGFTVNAKQGVVAVEIGELELCGGSGAGRFGLDLSHPKVKASLAGGLMDVGIEPCLKPFVAGIPFSGTGTFNVNVVTEGETSDQLMRALSGSLKIKAQEGTVPIDLTELLSANAPLADGWSLQDQTPYETLDADCRLSAGHIWCQMFKMMTEQGSVSGAGDVDIGRQTLDWDLSVTDRTNALAAAQRSAEPQPRVSIRGPLLQPLIRRADRPTFGDGSTQTNRRGATAQPR